MNNGQMLTVLRSEYLVDAQGINKVTGQPFTIAELEEGVRARLRG
jgi:2-oxoglutarate ferredoxin oxidoreductase subunit alpha